MGVPENRVKVVWAGDTSSFESVANPVGQ